MAGSSGRSTVMGGKAPAGTVSFTAVSVSFYLSSRCTTQPGVMDPLSACG